MALSSTLMLALVLSAKPVAKAYRGPLDSVDVISQSSGALARFDGVDRAGAEHVIDSVAKSLTLQRTLRVAFVRTKAGTLAAFTIDAEGGRLPFGRVAELARRLSLANGVVESWAFIAPGARDSTLEQEAFVRFERGDAKDAARTTYRDDPKYMEHVRGKASASSFRLARWPSYPLSHLAAALELPGRACLDETWQLFTLASTPWPDDAGENLVVAWIDLPGGMATEMAQASLRDKQSQSKLVADALEAARVAKTLADAPESSQSAAYDEGMPDSEKHARRSITLFLPAAELEAAQDAGSAEAISLSRVVQYAWRRAHPMQTPKR